MYNIYHYMTNCAVRLNEKEIIFIFISYSYHIPNLVFKTAVLGVSFINSLNRTKTGLNKSFYIHKMGLDEQFTKIISKSRTGYVLMIQFGSLFYGEHSA